MFSHGTNSDREICIGIAIMWPKQIVSLFPPKAGQHTATHFGLHTTLIVKKARWMTDDIVPTNDA